MSATVADQGNVDISNIALTGTIETLGQRQECDSLAEPTRQTAGWCYSSQKVPDCAEPCHWGKHSETCDGPRQSPIAIGTKNAILKDHLKPFSLHGYDKSHTVEIQNNGHSVQATLSSDVTISDGGLSGSFQAVQFHLHWGEETYGGSEHLIDSVRYAAELHIVHTREDSSDGDKFNYAVLAFLYKEVPNENPEYKPLISALEKIAHTGNKTKIDLTLRSLIPSEEKLRRYFRYNGSLTTPACNESVIWTVFEEEIELSQTQIRAFSTKLYFPDGITNMRNNYRPVQELHGRDVLRASATTALLQGATIFITSAFVYLVTGLQH